MLRCIFINQSKYGLENRPLSVFPQRKIKTIFKFKTPGSFLYSTLSLLIPAAYKALLKFI